MGYNLRGLNPTGNKEKVENELNKFRKYRDKIEHGLKEKYDLTDEELYFEVINILYNIKRSEPGVYERFSMWTWGPLWTFCEQVGRDIIPKNIDPTKTKGWGLNQKNSINLANRLKEGLESSEFDVYEKWFNEMGKDFINMKYHSYEIHKKNLELMRTDGFKYITPYKDYYFDKKIVKMLIRFLENCGGFVVEEFN